MICGVEVDAMICGVKPPAIPQPCHAMSHVDLASGSDLDVMIHGIETCNLDAMLHGVDPLGPKLSFCQPGVQMRTFFKKGPNCKKLEQRVWWVFGRYCIGWMWM